jgi:hypothetical protein
MWDTVSRSALSNLTVAVKADGVSPSQLFVPARIFERAYFSMLLSALQVSLVLPSIQTGQSKSLSRTFGHTPPEKIEGW